MTVPYISIRAIVRGLCVPFCPALLHKHIVNFCQ